MAHDVRDFEKEIIEESHRLPLVVDFWASWCVPCRILGPVLEKLATESGGRWRLAKVDTEAFPEEAARYGIRGIPNVKLFVDGRPVDEFVGALPESEVRRWLERAIPSDADRAARQSVMEARKLLLDDPRKTLEVLHRAEPAPDLVEEAANLVFLARTLLKLEEPGTLEDSEAGRRYLEGIRRLRSGDFDAALAAFIDVVRLDPSLDGDGPRRVCTAIFDYLGHDHPLVRRRRGDLAAALYV